MSGVSCYFGVTTSGKTTLALEHLKRDIAQDGRPALIIDAMPAKNLRGYRHEHSVEEVIRRLYEQRTHAVYTPRSEDELARIFAAVHGGGAAGAPVHVLWDEASLAQSPQRIDDRIAQAIRGWQHSDNSFRIVTQRPADLHGIVFATMPEVFCFRLERGSDLKRVQDELTLEPDTIKTLNQGQFELYSRDRFKKVDHGAVGTRVGQDPGDHADAVHPGAVRESPDAVAPALAPGVADSRAGAGPEGERASA